MTFLHVTTSGTEVSAGKAALDFGRQGGRIKAERQASKKESRKRSTNGHE
jgi:hypothetical protein